MSANIMDELSAPVKITFMNEVPRTVATWLWEPYIPRGKVTIVMGDPGEGKSTLMLQIAAAVTRGSRFPEMQDITRRPGYVLYQNAEDGVSDTIGPRLDMAQADCSRVFFCDETEKRMEMQSMELLRAVYQNRPDLVILDPLQAFLGENVDMHRANEVRPAMRFLAMLAEKSGAAIVLVGHMNKLGGMKAMYRSLGSIDLTASARSVLLIARDPKHKENRVILQVKNSLHEMASPSAFRIEEGRFRWIGAYEIEESELLGSFTTQQKDKVSVRARVFLEDLFEAPGTEIAQQEVLRMADSEDIGKSTVLAVKRELGLTSVKRGNNWYWTNQGRK